jgi:hypothetical protein
MVRRKGELSNAMIDHGWPYQVALEARLSMGDRYYTVHYFCQDLSLCPRGHGFYRDGRHFNVYCFAERAHADQFRAKFGGEMHDAQEEPRWWRKQWL